MSQKNKNTRLRNARIYDNYLRKCKEERCGIRYTSSEKTPEEVKPEIVFRKKRNFKNLIGAFPSKREN